MPEPQPRAIEAPPNLPEGETSSPLTAMLPMAGVLGSVLMMTVMRSSQFAVIGAFMLVIAVVSGTVMYLSQRGKARRTRRTQRTRYLEYLEKTRVELNQEDHQGRETARRVHPPPNALYDLVADPSRLWERRRSDPDFVHLRIGVGSVPLRLPRIERDQNSAVTPPDPFMVNEAEALRQRSGLTHDMPLTVPLDRVGNVSIIGEPEDTRRVIHALIAQASVSHAPDDLGIAVSSPANARHSWSWLKWLPHALDPEARDTAGPVRWYAHDPTELATLLASELRNRAARVAEVQRGLVDRSVLTRAKRLLIVLDTQNGPATELPRPDETVALTDLGLTVLHPVTRRIDEPGHVAVRVTTDGHRITVEDLRQSSPLTLTGTPDDCLPEQLDGLARLLAPLRLNPENDSADTPLGAAVDFPELAGIDDPGALNLRSLWAPRAARDFLRVPIGLGDLNEPVLLDLKESAELGMGPHGLCVGATGSGKSELLRTLLLALVATHAPDDLAVVLVDYKGGATFAPFEPLPHVAGMITNLESASGLVERVHDSLAGEVKRRQHVLKEAGHFANVGDYNAARRRHRPDLAPLPHLLVIIDEFGELLTAKPEFIDLFLSIGRIGRSIGVHLLLSSQRIESGKLRGLDTYLSYRLGLRTFSPEESRTVLDTSDAFELPPLPGFGYLKVDTSVYERFKAGYVSGPYHGPVRQAEEEDQGPIVVPYHDRVEAPQPSPSATSPHGPGSVPGDPPTDAQASHAPGASDSPPRGTTTPTLLSTVVAGLRDHGEPVRRIWLPPLPEAVALETIGGGVTDTPDRGLQLNQPAGTMRLPIGLLDDPANQWQGQWLLDLTVAGGHLAVIGGPQAGKSTLLRTAVLALSLTHTPREAAVYCLDLVGGGLRPLAGLPHVGGVATRTDRERVTRTVEEVSAMLTEREILFRDHGIDSVEALRQLRADGMLPELVSTEILLVIDGFGAVREEFDHLTDQVADLLRRGGGYGIHIVAGMLRWNDVRMNLQSSFGSRVELRLNDAQDSGTDRRMMETIPHDTPGRALTHGKLFAHAALPRLDVLDTGGDPADGLDDAVRRVHEAWRGDPVRPVRVLPPRLSTDELPSVEQQRHVIPFGVHEDLTPAVLDLHGPDPHLMILGDSECGKTNLLHVIARGLVERHARGELVFAVMDPRRVLRGVIPKEFQGGYAHNGDLAARLASGIATRLQERAPDSSLSPDELDAGTHFTGPRIVILIDDYDILATAQQRPLSPLVPYMPSAQDMGVNVILTRRVAGASRALYEPFLQSLKENGSSALLMTGERQEGQLYPKLYPSQQPPGRGTFVRRGAPYRLTQTALLPPDASS